MLVLMAWGHGSAGLLERFHPAREAVDNSTRAQTYQGFIKAFGRWGLELVELAAYELREAMARLAGPHATRRGWRAFAVDGSRFQVPRTAANEREMGTGSKSGPQLWITTLWHMGLGLPWAWRIAAAAGASEREHLGKMLGLLPRRALLIADAGFTGYGLLGRIIDHERHFLIRVGRSVSLLRELGYAQREGGQTVYLWPSYAQREKRPPLTLRLIKVPAARGKGAVYLLSSVLDPEQLSDEDAAALYRMRWGVECFYRSLKQTMQARKLSSKNPWRATLELHGVVLGLWLLGLLSVGGIIERGGDPLRWSAATALKLVRRMMRRPHRRRPTLRAQLAAALQDAYPRRGPKATRDWPRKKHADPPPGRPDIRKARASQRHDGKILLQT